MGKKELTLKDPTLFIEPKKVDNDFSSVFEIFSVDLLGLSSILVISNPANTLQNSVIQIYDL
jgi:hypothetical protein